MIRRLLIGLLLPVLPLLAADEGPVSVRLTAPVGEITVGDPVTLLLTVTHPPGTVFELPDATQLWRASGEEDLATPAHLAVEGVEPLVAEPPRPGETSWRLHIRLFAPGSTTVPGIPVTYRLPGASASAVSTTDPVTVNVGSVLKTPEEPPADIKGAWSLPREWLGLILGIVALLAAALAAYWIFRRLRRLRAGRVIEPAPAPAAPGLTAWERANRDLEALLASRLLATGRYKEFHVILSEILKRFLGAQHGFDALDCTSEEVLEYLGRAGVPPALKDAARRFLVACDLVKFAKLTPAEEVVRETIAAARGILETGRPAVSPGEERAA